MAHKQTRARRASNALARDLMLAPAVVAMRMPLMAAEAARGDRAGESYGAVAEKMAAFAEGVAAAQLAWMRSAMLLPLAFAAATSPMSPLVEMTEAVATAAFAPAGKQVRRNHRRLSRRKA